MTAPDITAAVETALAEHADCTMNDTRGSIDNAAVVTGQDVWSCGIVLPFRDDLEDAERAHTAAAVGPLVAEARAAALRKAADEIEHGMGPVWGGDAAWLSTGTHIANLMAEILRERADRETR